jgi:hypothetical protein
MWCPPHTSTPHIQSHNRFLRLNNFSERLLGPAPTASTFSPDTHNFVKNIGKRITLIDGQMLARLMVEKDVGVSISKTYVVKQIDENYFVDA